MVSFLPLDLRKESRYHFSLLCFCEKIDPLTLLVIQAVTAEDLFAFIRLITLLSKLLFLLILLCPFSIFISFPTSKLQYQRAKIDFDFGCPLVVETSFKVEIILSPTLYYRHVLQHTVYLIPNRQLHSVWGRCRCEG